MGDDAAGPHATLGKGSKTEGGTGRSFVARHR